jgi:glycosyltransferase involved in cell wall biosynthesis
MASRNGRMKVLHVGKFYPPQMGGIEMHLQTLCRELRSAIDLRVIVASGNREACEEIADGVPISRVRTLITCASTPLCPDMIRQIRNCDADVVHIHWPNPAAVLAYLASGHGAHLVLTYHSDAVRQRLLGSLFAPWLQLALRRSTAVIATSENYRNTSRVLNGHLDRCHVIPYGIQLHKFEACQAADVQGIRSRYGSRLIVSVGRLVYYKGFEYLIEAMKEVDGTLLIVGDGPLLTKLREMVVSLNLSQKVHFLGGLGNEEISPYYHAADVFALASTKRSEAFGIVQIEAMAAGLPIVNTNLDSGVPFVSQHGITGLTVEPKNTKVLAIAINTLLDNEDLRRSFGTAGRKRARGEFSSGAMASRTLRLYEAVIADSRGPKRLSADAVNASRVR